MIDRLAAEGVRFELAQTQWPKTGPSFSSMLSSTYPKDNGVVTTPGDGALPAVLVNDAVLAHGRYPTRQELIDALSAVPAPTQPSRTVQDADGGCCTPGSGCC